MYKVEDFINIEENKSPFDINDLVHICKRVNNSKREYLFVNKYQGKHIPESPNNILGLLNCFCREVKQNLNFQEKILIVGFAETATGIAEYLTYQLSLDSDFSKSVVYHLQTSREKYQNCAKLFNFNEEHSHAVNQNLYSQRVLPYYDRVVFVEDEITTGKTILNFIDKFKKINSNCKYSVASILNWQNKECRDIFELNGIQRIYLVSGEIKDKLPVLNNIVSKEVKDYMFTMNLDDKINHKNIIVNCNLPNSRLGVDFDSFKLNIDNIIDRSVISLSSCLDNLDSVMVIGTEEFMFYPLMVARDLEVSFGCNVRYRATTRSPIITSGDETYVIKDGITLPSAYDKERQTYLYNMFGDYNKIVVISDVKMTKEFKNSLILFSNENDKEIFFVEL